MTMMVMMVIMINDYDHYDDDNSNYDYSIIMIIHDTLLGNKVTQNLSLPMRGQDIDELFAEQDATPATPATVDYGEWKANVEELKRVLDEYDGKLDPNSEIEKEYSSLEKLAEETKVKWISLNLIFTNDGRCLKQRQTQNTNLYKSLDTTSLFRH